MVSVFWKPLIIFGGSFFETPSVNVSGDTDGIITVMPNRVLRINEITPSHRCSWIQRGAKYLLRCLYGTEYYLGCHKYSGIFSSRTIKLWKFAWRSPLCTTETKNFHRFQPSNFMGLNGNGKKLIKSRTACASEVADEPSGRVQAICGVEGRRKHVWKLWNMALVLCLREIFLCEKIPYYRICKCSKIWVFLAHGGLKSCEDRRSPI